MYSDVDLLASLEEKLREIRDCTRGVGLGWNNGFYLWGEGGCSKSFTVRETLIELGRPYKLSNSRITAKGLFDLLKGAPDAVHVLEDAEGLFHDSSTYGVLRSGLSGEPERTITWVTSQSRQIFTFTGGIIFTANRGLNDIPEARALATRMKVVQYLVTNAEMAALMKKLANKGFSYNGFDLTPEECREVVAEIVARTTQLERNLDLRLMFETFKDRLQADTGAAECDWRDLLGIRLKQQTLQFSPEMLKRRKAKKDESLEIAKRLASLPAKEAIAAWQKETGLSRATFYRCLSQVSVA